MRTRFRAPKASLYQDIERALDPIDPEQHDGFVLLRRRGVPLLLKLLASGELVPFDVATLLKLACRIRPASGYAMVSVTTLAAESRSSVDMTAHSVRRLARAGLVVRVGNPRSRPARYAVSPVVVQTGSMSARSMSAQAFQRAMAEAPPPAPVTEAAVRARQALPHHQAEPTPASAA